MAACVSHIPQAPALLPAFQPPQRIVLHNEQLARQQGAPTSRQQPWGSCCRRQRWPAGSGGARARCTAAAAVSRASIEERLTVALDTPASKEAVSELAAAVEFIEGMGASVNAAFLLVKEAGKLPPEQCRAALATVQPKFRLFRQRCGAAPEACDSLAIALIGCPNTQAALALPVADFEAALDFIESQASLLPEFAAAASSSSAAGGAGAADAGRAAAAAAAAAVATAAAEAGASPPVLYAFFKLVLLAGGALLQQHPAPFLQHTAPWLRQQLGWCDADVAAAALLSGRMPELCRLDTRLAQSSLDWLLSQGLSQQQAGRLLLAGLRSADGDLLTGSPAELAQRQHRAEQLAQQWGVTPALAAVLWLTQGTHMTSGREQDTGRLAAVLRGEVGMSDAQLLAFALGGGLRGDGGPGWALQPALARLKQLLLVCGSWQGVAALLEQQPQLLCAKAEAVAGLLPQPAQQGMWQVVAQMQAAE